MLSHVTDIKVQPEKTTHKAIKNWGHPCIYREGFKWDLKKVGAYPCIYQVKINGKQAYRARVLWDAGNDVYVKFLDADEWYNMARQDFGAEANVGLVEFL